MILNNTGDNKIYDPTKLHVEDKICIEIIDGIAYYLTSIMYIRLVTQKIKLIFYYTKYTL